MYQFGLIGCGSAASNHVPEINKAGNLAAVFDTDADRAQAIARDQEVTVYNSLDGLLQDERIEIVCICSPNGFHAEHIIKALQAGKHVVCETPVCLTTAAAWQIIETAKFCRKKLFVADTVKYQLQQNRLINTIATQDSFFEGKFVALRGLSRHKSWKETIFPGGGTLYSYFGNEMSLLTRLFGEIQTATRTLPYHHIPGEEIEEQGEVQLQMKNGAGGICCWSLNKEDISAQLTIKHSGEEKTYDRDELFRLTGSAPEAYTLFYKDLMQGLDNHNSYNGIFEVLPIIANIEKIYSAVSSNPS